MKTNVKSMVALVVVALSLSLVSMVQADTIWDFSYTGSGVTASGTLTTSDTLTALTGGSVTGLSGYQIIGMTGERNNVNITGVEDNPNFPGTSSDHNYYDNALIVDPNGIFDVDGLNFNLADGSIYNLSSYLTPTGGGTYDTITTAQVAGTLVTFNVSPVPDNTSAAGLLAAGLGSLVIIAKRNSIKSAIAML